MRSPAGADLIGIIAGRRYINFMNEFEIQNIILKKTYTKSDYIRRVNQIRAYLEARFYKNYLKSFSDYLFEQLVPLHDHDAIGHLDEHFFNLFTQDNFYPLLNSLTESIKSIPVLTLYLPVIIDNSLIAKLCLWFRANLHPELIMEVHCNPNLVAGAAYVWNNQYHDLSLRNFFSVDDTLITKIVDSYAKTQL